MKYERYANSEMGNLTSRKLRSQKMPPMKLHARVDLQLPHQLPVVNVPGVLYHLPHAQFQLVLYQLELQPELPSYPYVSFMNQIKISVG